MKFYGDGSIWYNGGVLLRFPKRKNPSHTGIMEYLEIEDDKTIKILQEMGFTESHLDGFKMAKEAPGKAPAYGQSPELSQVLPKKPGRPKGVKDECY